MGRVSRQWIVVGGRMERKTARFQSRPRRSESSKVTSDRRKDSGWKDTPPPATVPGIRDECAVVKRGTRCRGRRRWLTPLPDLTRTLRR